MRSFLSIFLCFLIFPASGEEVTASWSLSGKESLPGRSLVLILEVQGTDQVILPELSLEGQQINRLSASPLVSRTLKTVDGGYETRAEKGFRATWSFRSLRPGYFTLLGIKIRAGERDLLLPPLRWTVTEPSGDPDFRLVHTSAHPLIVPGLETEYTLTWLKAAGATDPQFVIPLLDQPGLTYLQPRVVGDEVLYTGGGREIRGKKTTLQEGGKTWTAESFTFLFRTGEPAVLDLRNTAVSFVDSRGDVQALSAGPLRLEVKPLPEDGRPAHFSGLIGHLELTWSVPPGPYQVSQPIPLLVKYSGQLNRDELDLDLMLSWALKKTPFSLSTGKVLGKGDRLYSLISREGGTQILPSLSLNYYDPATGTYGVTRTPPITLEFPGKSAFRSGEPQNLPPPLMPASFPSWVWTALPPAAGLILLLSAFWRSSRIRRFRLLENQWREKVESVSLPEGRAGCHQGRKLLESWFEIQDRYGRRPQEYGVLWEELRAWTQASFQEELPPWNPRDRWEKGVKPWSKGV